MFRMHSVYHSLNIGPPAGPVPIYRGPTRCPVRWRLLNWVTANPVQSLRFLTKLPNRHYVYTIRSDDRPDFGSRRLDATPTLAFACHSCRQCLRPPSPALAAADVFPHRRCLRRQLRLATRNLGSSTQCRHIQFSICIQLFVRFVTFYCSFLFSFSESRCVI